MLPLVILGIERVHAVVLGSYVYDVVRRIRRGNENVWNIERLGGLLSIQVLREELSKLARVHVRMSQDGLLRVLTRARVVVMVGQNTDLDGGSEH